MDTIFWEPILTGQKRIWDQNLMKFLIPKFDGILLESKIEWDLLGTKMTSVHVHYKIFHFIILF